MADRRWPDMCGGVIAELRRHPGRFALIETNAYTADAAGHLAAVVDQQPLGSAPPSPRASDAVNEQAVVDLLAPSLVLTDIDSLFWRPRFGLDVLRLIRVIARRGPGAVSVWPGVISGGEAQYSEPGRVDHYRQVLSDALVLTPLETTFDDDPPFDVKRIP